MAETTDADTGVIFVTISDSMAIGDDFAVNALHIHLNIGQSLVLSELHATNFAGSFSQVDNEGIVIGDDIILAIDSVKSLSESMQAGDSIAMHITRDPPDAPDTITAPMPSLTITETEDLDESSDLTEPKEAVVVNGVFAIDSLDEEGLESLLNSTGMPVYNVGLGTSSSGTTLVLPTFIVSLEVGGDSSDVSGFLTPTLSTLPAGTQVIIPIDVEASLGGAGNLDLLGTMTVSFTPVDSTDNFTMLLNVLDNNPDTADALPDDISAFFIDVTIGGDFAGALTPSDEGFYEEQPRVTFTVTEEWAQDNDVERDANNVPIISLFLLDEANGDWIEIPDGDIESPTSAVNSAYTYTATLPHFSTYAFTASVEEEDDDGGTRGGGGGGAGRTSHVYARSLFESLLVSGAANLGGGEGIIKDLSESLMLTVQPQPELQRVITIHNVSVAVNVADVRPAAFGTAIGTFFETLGTAIATSDFEMFSTAISMLFETFGSAVATLNFEITNKGGEAEEMVLRYGYSDPATGEMAYEAEETVVVGAGESIVRAVEIPFSATGVYDVMIEVESADDRTLATTDVAIDVPWLAVYLYILVAIAVAVVAISIVYVVRAMRRPGGR